MADRDFKGVWIPREIWLNSALNITDKAVLIEIDSLDNGEDGCWAGNKHFAEMLGCTERQASASIAKLVNMGYVKVLRFDGRNRFLRSCLKEKVCEADTKDASSSITEPSEQPDENFYAASPKLPHSNPMSNTKRNPMRNINESAEESAGACEEVNPYGGDRIGDAGEHGTSSDPAARGHLPHRGKALGETDTVERYALDNLRVMTPGHMQEFDEFLTVHGVSDELMRYAIDVACGNGAPVWNYVAQVLYGWLDAGVKSVGDAKAEQEKHRKKRRGAIDRENNRVPLPYGGGIIV